jgi:hypothetical protein
MHKKINSLVERAWEMMFKVCEKSFTPDGVLGKKYCLHSHSFTESFSLALKMQISSRNYAACQHVYDCTIRCKLMNVTEWNLFVLDDEASWNIHGKGLFRCEVGAREAKVLGGSLHHFILQHIFARN